MALTKEEKKKQILSYLGTNAKKGNWFSLSKKEIYNKFCDKEFNEEDIFDLIEELRKDRRISKSRIGFNINYPKSIKEKIKIRLKGYVETPRYILFAVGIYFLFVFLSLYPRFYQLLQIKLNAKTGQDFFILGAMVGIFGSYSIGWLMEKIYRYFEEKIPLLHKNKNFIIPFFVIGMISFGIVIVYSLMSKKPIEIIHIITLISVTVIGGFAYLNWKKKSESLEYVK